MGRITLWAFAGVLLWSMQIKAQSAPGMRRPSAKELNAAVGDTADNPGKIDTSLAPAITHHDVRRAMQKVADWSLQQVRSEASQNILEKMNGVELTDSFLCDQLRKCFEKILRS